MVWVTEKSGVKFVCWNELKEDMKKEDAIVLKDGDFVEGISESITEERDKEGELVNVKFKIKTKEFEEPVFIWSNASILRQYQKLGIKEGEVLRFTYRGQYDTQFGKKGNRVELAVDRDEEGDKKKK